MIRRLLFPLAVSAFLALVPPGRAAKKTLAQEYFVFIGTYTGANSKGIYAWRMKAATGEFQPLGLVGETVNPSFLAVHPNGDYLYAVSEVESFEGENSGFVSAFSIDPRNARLSLLDSASTKGKGPCHVTVDKTGRNVLVANYSSGSVTVIPLHPNGRLKTPSSTMQHSGSGKNPQRQEGPHAHSVNLAASNKFAMVADLGLDQVFIYRFDANSGTLTPDDPPSVKVAAGSGPRHFAFHPDGKYAYVISELASTVTAFDFDAKKGSLTAIQTITTLPADFHGESSTAEVQVHPSGKFLYGSNRGHDSIAVFAIAKDGKLTLVEHMPTQGKTPRNFGIDPGGAFLLAANQDSDTVVAFRIDQTTGRLTPTGQKLEAGSPVCVKFVAAH